MSEFTVAGDAALDLLIEAQLDGIAEAVRATVPAREVEALVLGGGYGRGEGGALRTEDGLRPYNDYDLVLIHRRTDRARLAADLRRVNEEQGARCGIHVDITPLALDSLSRLPHTLTWYELQKGHRVLFGPSDVLERMGQRRLEDVAASEWGRLLFNRGSGLLFCLWALSGRDTSVLGGEAFDAFATRQVQKAWLSLGDVFLVGRGKYDASVQKRRQAWLSLGRKVPDWSDAYLRAIEFKLSPTMERPHEEVIEELAQLCALYGEELSRHPAAESRPLVGVYATARKLSPLLWPLSRPWRYPRERLSRALAHELRGDSFERRRLVGSPADYIRLWESYA